MALQSLGVVITILLPKAHRLIESHNYLLKNHFATPLLSKSVSWVTKRDLLRWMSTLHVVTHTSFE